MQGISSCDKGVKGKAKSGQAPAMVVSPVLQQPVATGTIPPLPSFPSGSSPAVPKVLVVVNGVEREGIVDHRGRIQLKSEAPEYYTIASDEHSLPRFGESSKPLPKNSPFSPDAASAFFGGKLLLSGGSPPEELVAARGI